MGVFFAGAGVRSRRCWDAISSVLQAVRSGVGAGVGCDETGLLVRSPCCFSLSLLFSWGVID